MIHTDASGRRFGTGLLPTSDAERRVCSTRYRGPKIPRSEWRTMGHRPYCEPIWDQGQQGSCAGHATVAALCLARNLHGHAPARLSPCFTYGQVNGGQDRGATIGSVLQTIQRDGSCLETTVGPGRIDKRQYPAAAYDEAKRFRAELAEELVGFDEIISATQLGDPVVIGIMLGNRFEPDARGVIPDKSGDGGGHAMLVVDPVQIDGVWCALTQNSWGGRWGDGGFCLIPESYFRDWHEAFRVITSIDDPQGTNPPIPKG